MSVLIKNGRIVTAADDYVADVYVEDETVTLIGESLDHAADKVIDAAGKYLLPGCVDPHTHLDMPFGGTVTIDDFESGQASAAFGGTTCHVDFAIQPQGRLWSGRCATRIGRWSMKQFWLSASSATRLPVQCSKRCSVRVRPKASKHARWKRWRSSLRSRVAQAPMKRTNAPHASVSSLSARCILSSRQALWP